MVLVVPPLPDGGIVKPASNLLRARAERIDEAGGPGKARHAFSPINSDERAQTAQFLIVIRDDVFVPALLIIAVASMLMAPMGARLAHGLPVKLLRQLFALLLLALALYMLYKGLVSIRA